MGVEVNNFTRPICAGENGELNTIYDTANTRQALKGFLKSKILKRRKNLGLDQIKVDFTPKKIYPMSEEEKQKDEKRKDINRRSAHRSRQKQKTEYETNKIILKKLREENEELIGRVNGIVDEKTKVIRSLRQILPEKYIHEALRQAEHSDEKTKGLLQEHGHETLREYNQMEVAEMNELTGDIQMLESSDNHVEEVDVKYDSTCEEGSTFLASLLTVYVGNGDGMAATVAFQETDECVTLQCL